MREFTAAVASTHLRCGLCTRTITAGKPFYQGAHRPLDYRHGNDAEVVTSQVCEGCASHLVVLTCAPLVDQINEFDRQCNSVAYTDQGITWDLFNAIRVFLKGDS